MDEDGNVKVSIPKEVPCPTSPPLPSAEMFKINVNYYAPAKQAYLKKATELMLLWTQLKP